LRHWKTRCWAAALAAVAGVLCFAPLFDLLAYEFCAVLAIVASFASAHLGSLYAQQNAKQDVRNGFLSAAAQHLLLLTVPLLFISLNALRVRNCNYLEGFELFLLLPCASSVCSTAVGYFCARRAPPRCWPTLAALAVIVVSLGWGLVRLFVSPALFGYDPFVGFFPGPLYDEDVGVSTTLVVYRGMNFAFVVAAIAWLAGAKGRAALCGAIGLTLFLLGDRLGFRTSHASLHEALPGRVESQHIILRYDSARLDRSNAEDLARDHEWRYTQVAREFGAAPHDKIVSYVFPSAQAKRRRIGAGNTSIANPWRREIFLNYQAPPHSVVRHELAHVIAGAVRDDWFRAPITNLGLIEGLATALENPVNDGLTLHQQAKALRELGHAPSLQHVFGLGLLSEAPARSYTAAGSVIRWLLETRGAAYVRAIYARGKIDDLATIENQWLRFLDSQVVNEEAVAALRERFRRPAIFRRTCAHEIAQLKLAAEQQTGSDRVETRRKIANFEPSDPAHAAALARALAANAEVSRAQHETLQVFVHPNTTASLRHEMHELVGDLAWKAGDLEGARAAYTQALQQASGEGSQRQVRAKLYALKQETTEPLYRRFFLQDGPRDATATAVLLREIADLKSDGFPLYLLGRQLMQHDQYDDALRYLTRAEDLGLPDTGFIRENRRLIFWAAWRLRHFDRATAAAERLLQLGTTPGQRLEATDMLDRIRWERTTRLTFR
jgi:tetratricopeptide (TPR) repeat protein